MNMTEPLNFDIGSLKGIDEIISPALIENLKTFTSQEHRYDALRSIIYGKLNHLSRPIVQDSAEWRDMDLESKCQVINEIQECFYDLQLVEQASQKPLFSLARAIFSINKRRCAVKAPAVESEPSHLVKSKRTNLVKSKPSKKQKLDTALRRSEREVKSPSVTLKNAAEDASNGQNDERTANNDTTTRRRGYSRAAGGAVSSRAKSDFAEDSRQDSNRATPSINDNGAKDDCDNADTNRTVSPALDSALPRRRAAALAAAMSVAETVNPHRSNSPRKRTSAANNHVDDDGSGDGCGASTSSVQDEPTYCICEQVSFGDMICCDYSKCPIEWFHFSCVNIKLKPKGKKWFCPLCRGDKPTVLKASLQSRR